MAMTAADRDHRINEGDPREARPAMQYRQPHHTRRDHIVDAEVMKLELRAALVRAAHADGASVTRTRPAPGPVRAADAPTPES
jgi:hypothetical protein